jgi:hypothetical protein
MTNQEQIDAAQAQLDKALASAPDAAQLHALLAIAAALLAIAQQGAAA